MTQDERDAAIGKLIKQYSDNEQTIAALRSELLGMKHFLNNLYKGLDNPKDVIPTETAGEKGFETIYAHGPIPASEIDRLHVLLTDYHAAIDNKKELEPLLKQAGLENLITQ